MKYVFIRLLLFLGGVLIIGSVFLDWNGQLQFLSSESRLSAFETRIASVEEEFMRRSPALYENFSQFDQCARRSQCNPASILGERDRLLQELWPDMLQRLMVSGDWGDGSLTAALHHKFTEDVRQAGGVPSARRCQPLLRYYLLSHTSGTTYTYQGLHCPNN